MALTAVLLAGGIASCSDDWPADPAVIDALTDVHWRIDGYIDGHEVLDVVPGGHDAYLEFERGGEAGGNDGCAGFSYESYEVRAEEIRYPELRRIEAPLCPLPERHRHAYFSATSGRVEYELDGDRLTLVGDDGIGVVFITGA